MKDIIYSKRNERVKLFFSWCQDLKDALSHLRDNWRPTLDNDSYLTDAEVAEKLKVTRRTLNEYRNNGLLPYYAIGGKYIYSARDLSKVLKDNYRAVIND